MLYDVDTLIAIVIFSIIFILNDKNKEIMFRNVHHIFRQERDCRKVYFIENFSYIHESNSSHEKK